MKSYLKGRAISRRDVEAAYASWSKSAGGRKNVEKVTRKYGDPDALVGEIYDELVGRRLSLPPIQHIRRADPGSGKVRDVGVQSPKQQVCDHLAVALLKPMFDAHIGFYQAASIPGRGQVFAAKALRRWARDGGWFVKLDVVKYYPSVDQAVALALLERYVRSPDVVYLVRTLLFTYGHGLDIGSYLSQYLANWLMSFAYHRVEDMRKERRGAPRRLVSHQLMYMDDVYLQSRDRRDLMAAARALVSYMRDVMHLEVRTGKPCRIGSEPLTMCGFVIRPERTTVAPRTFLRARRALSRVSRRPCVRRAYRAASYWGFLRNSDSDGFIRRSGAEAALRKARQTISDRDRKARHAEGDLHV